MVSLLRGPLGRARNDSREAVRRTSLGSARRFTIPAHPPDPDRLVYRHLWRVVSGCVDVRLAALRSAGHGGPPKPTLRVDGRNPFASDSGIARVRIRLDQTESILSSESPSP